MSLESSTPKLELIQVADVVAREKGIQRDEVIEAMEQAIQKAGRAKYGNEHDIQATINRTSGDISLVRRTEVVELVEDEITQISLEEAQKRDIQSQKVPAARQELRRSQRVRRELA